MLFLPGAFFRLLSTFASCMAGITEVYCYTWLVGQNGVSKWSLTFSPGFPKTTILLISSLIYLT
jgi:hypothetical protein